MDSNARHAGAVSRKEMTFAEKHTNALLSGEKTVTARLADEWGGVFDGDQLELIETDGDRIGSADVKRARSMPAAEAFEVVNLHSGHRSYDTLSTFLDVMREYYPDTDIDEETEMKLIHFEVS